MILKLFGEKDLALPFNAKYEEENIITLDGPYITQQNEIIFFF